MERKEAGLGGEEPRGALRETGELGPREAIGLRASAALPSRSGYAADLSLSL